VIATEAHPSISETILGLVPRLSSSVAAVWGTSRRRPALRSLCRMVVVVNVRLAGVMLVLFLTGVVMAVGEGAVIVLVRVP
jgi:hypothetical protein